jgi:nucleosome binding factor SPN SPT16 subunit
MLEFGIVGVTATPTAMATRLRVSDYFHFGREGKGIHPLLGQEGYAPRTACFCSSAASQHAAKIVAQIQTADSPIPIEILQMEKGKDAASSQALTTFAEHYAAHARVGHLAKDTHTGKIIDEWNAAVKAAAAQPQLVDAGPALSAVLCAKDDEELVRAVDHVYGCGSY